MSVTLRSSHDVRGQNFGCRVNTIEAIILEHPAPTTPFGAKGVGEPPSVPTSGAVGNAIAKVVGRHVTQLPMTAERVWLAANSPAGEDQ